MNRPKWEDKFTYDPVLGELRWKVKASRNGRSQVGDVAGTTLSGPYPTVSVKNRPVRVHRIVYEMCIGGPTPKGMEIDHIDGDPHNNRLSNLRCVSRQENRKNQKERRDNKSGCTGVRPRGNKWVAHIGSRSIQEHLGTFPSYDEAVAARKAAEARLGFHPNHGRRIE